MPESEPSADRVLPDDLAEVGVYRTAPEGFDHSLVVLALGHVCWLMPSAAGFRLLVEPAVVGRVRAELGSYDRECLAWPPRLSADTTALPRLDLLTPLLWLLAVLAVYRGQSQHPGWTEAGALDAAAVFDHGEFWRTFTALFLHANADHLVSNLFGGVFVFAAVLTIFGRARGWLLLGLAAIAANLAVAAMHYPGPYVSLGASTAIFAALGLLTGRAVRLAVQARHPHRWRSFFVPFAAGLTVLALYGAGAPPVDVLAHVSGFVVGGLLGFMAGRPR
jgi:membrane associated rhomboid family serine protease